MLASVRSASVLGIEAATVQVEVDIAFGLPQVVMVGLPDAAVRESRDRVRSAIRNSGYEFPPHRITVNLAPAALRKGGSTFDLPVALGILAASGVLTRPDAAEAVVVGELSLDGVVNPCRGVLPVAVMARRTDAWGLLVPASNAREAGTVAGLRIFPVQTLREAVDVLNAGTSAVPAALPPPELTGHTPGVDLADVRGQLVARRALEIAAAGGHNLLFWGPPGAGKTMLARRLPSILPPLTFEEALDCTTIHSVAGLLPPDAGLISERPFRAPHHTVSPVALIGGGAVPRPGEISLAHHGVLFLDEMPEFPPRALEALRQPLEEGAVTIARASHAARFPARFVLVGAMNPCPCGHHGSPHPPCRCTPAQISAYSARLSGPLRDRFDLWVPVPPLAADDLDDAPPGESSAVVRARVSATRDRQSARASAAAAPGALPFAHGLSRPARALLRQALTRFGLSGRGHARVLRVARTIADLAGEAEIDATHVAEALHYRRPIL